MSIELRSNKKELNMRIKVKTAKEKAPYFTELLINQN